MRNNVVLSEKELAEVRKLEARLRLKTIREKEKNLQGRSANVSSYHSKYFTDKALIRKGHYNK